MLLNLSVLEQPQMADATRSAAMSSLVLAFVVGLEEWSQRWIPARTASIFDLVASYLRIAAFA